MTSTAITAKVCCVIRQVPQRGIDITVTGSIFQIASSCCLRQGTYSAWWIVGNLAGDLRFGVVQRDHVGDAGVSHCGGLCTRIGTVSRPGGPHSGFFSPLCDYRPPDQPDNFSEAM
jgi:hypothetical protein